MKTKSSLFIILVVLSLSAARGQDEETDLLAGNQGKTPETNRAETLTAGTRERLARMIFEKKAPDRIMTKRVVLSGPLVTLFHSDDLVDTFNPFSLAHALEPARTVPADIYLPRPRGWVLFRLEF